MSSSNDAFSEFFGGGGDSSTTTDAGSGSGSAGGDGGGGDSGGSIFAPEWLTDIRGVLEAFGRSPVGFVVGAVLTTILGGIERILTALLDAITFVFLGSDPGSTSGALGLADIPIFAVEVAVDGTEPVAEAGFSVLETAIDTAAATAAAAGPFAPVVIAGILAAVAIAGAIALRTLVDVAADGIPILGGLIE